MFTEALHITFKHSRIRRRQFAERPRALASRARFNLPESSPPLAE
jgi:hypothetical protein